MSYTGRQSYTDSDSRVSPEHSETQSGVHYVCYTVLPGSTHLPSDFCGDDGEWRGKQAQTIQIPKGPLSCPTYSPYGFSYDSSVVSTVKAAIQSPSGAAPHTVGGSRYFHFDDIGRERMDQEQSREKSLSQAGFGQTSALEELPIFQLQPPPKPKLKRQLSSENGKQVDPLTTSKSPGTNMSPSSGVKNLPMNKWEAMTTSNQPEPPLKQVGKGMPFSGEYSRNVIGTEVVGSRALAGSKRDSSQLLTLSDRPVPSCSISYSPKKLKSDFGPIPSPIKKSPGHNDRLLHNSQLLQSKNNNTVGYAPRHNCVCQSIPASSVRRHISFPDISKSGETMDTAEKRSTLLRPSPDYDRQRSIPSGSFALPGKKDFVLPCSVDQLSRRTESQEDTTATSCSQLQPAGTMTEPQFSRNSVSEKTHLSSQLKWRNQEPDVFLFPGSVCNDEVDGFNSSGEMEVDLPNFSSYHHDGSSNLPFKFNETADELQHTTHFLITKSSYFLPEKAKLSWMPDSTRLKPEPSASHSARSGHPQRMSDHYKTLSNTNSSKQHSFSIPTSFVFGNTFLPPKSPKRSHLGHFNNRDFTEGNQMNFPQASVNPYRSQSQLQYAETDDLDSHGIKVHMPSASHGRESKHIAIGDVEILDTSEPDDVVHTSDYNNNCKTNLQHYDAKCGGMCTKADTNVHLISLEELSENSMNSEDDFAFDNDESDNDDDYKDYEDEFKSNVNYNRMFRHQSWDEIDGLKVSQKYDPPAPSPSRQVKISNPGQLVTKHANRTQLQQDTLFTNRTPSTQICENPDGRRSKTLPITTHDQSMNVKQREATPYRARAIYNDVYRLNSNFTSKLNDSCKLQMSSTSLRTVNKASRSLPAWRQLLRCNTDDDNNDNSGDEVDGLGDDKKKGNSHAGKQLQKDDAKDAGAVVHIFDKTNKNLPQSGSSQPLQPAILSQQRQQDNTERPLQALKHHDSKVSQDTDTVRGKGDQMNTRPIPQEIQSSEYKQRQQHSTEYHRQSEGDIAQAAVRVAAHKQRSRSDASITELPADSLPRASSSPSKLGSSSDNTNQPHQFYRPWLASPTKLKPREVSVSQPTGMSGKRFLFESMSPARPLGGSDHANLPSASVSESPALPFPFGEFSRHPSIATDMITSSTESDSSFSAAGQFSNKILCDQASTLHPRQDVKWNKRRSEGDPGPSSMSSWSSPYAPQLNAAGSSNQQEMRQSETRPRRKLDLPSPDLSSQASLRFEHPGDFHLQSGHGSKDAMREMQGERSGANRSNLPRGSEGGAAKRARDEVDIKVSVEDIMAETHQLGQRLEEISQSEGRNCECARIERDILNTAMDMFQRLGADVSANDVWHRELQNTNQVIKSSLDLVENFRRLCRHDRRVTDVFEGSVVIRIKCRTLTSLVDLCDLHKSGELQAILCNMLTAAVRMERGMTLRVTLDEKNVKTCTNFLLRKLQRSQPAYVNPARKRPHKKSSKTQREVRSTENLLDCPSPHPSPQSSLSTRSTSTPALYHPSPLSSPVCINSPCMPGSVFGRERKMSMGEISRIAFQELNISDADSPRSPSHTFVMNEEFGYVLSSSLLRLNSPNRLVSTSYHNSPSTSPLPSPRRVKRCDIIQEQENIQHDQD